MPLDEPVISATGLPEEPPSNGDVDIVVAEHLSGLSEGAQVDDFISVDHDVELILDRRYEGHVGQRVPRFDPAILELIDILVRWKPKRRPKGYSEALESSQGVCHRPVGLIADRADPRRMMAKSSVPLVHPAVS